MKRLLVILLLWPLALTAQQTISATFPIVVTPTVATPTFSPAAGTYSSTQTVTISTTTPLAVLCYTTDGTTPTESLNLCSGGTTSTYSTPISVATTQTVKAIGTLAGYTDSAVGSATYTIGCAGLPSWNLKLLGTTPTAGSVSTWADSSGNGNTATMIGSPIAGVGTPTPRGTQTVVFTGTQYGNLTSGITASSGITICAVYILSSTANKITLTGNQSSNGAPLYWPTGGVGSNVQGLDAAFSSNIGSASDAATTSWTSTCVTFATGPGGKWQFYKDGSTDGPNNTSWGGTSFGAAIDQVFVDDALTYYFTGAVAELDILNNTITPTQATAIHSCAVSTYGVP